MGCTGGQDRGTGEAERSGAPDFTELCQGAMPAGMKELCGDQMREMMPRRLAHFPTAPKDPAGTEEPAETEAKEA